MTEDLVKNIGIIGQRKVGIAAQREAAMQQKQEPVNLSTMPNRLGLVFDNSGSMSEHNAIEDAKEGCEEFFRVCNPLDTAISLHDFSGGGHSLTNELIDLIKTTRKYTASAGTPLYSTLNKMLTEVPITRGIVFSDGEPTDEEYQTVSTLESKGSSVIDKYIQHKIPIDTVYIGPANGSGIRVLKSIADRTGGIFLHFQKGSSTMKNAFKYLAPRYRAMLTDGNFKKRLEQGEIK